MFGAMLEAFEYGAPPHGGIALGIDRWAALLSDQTNIREVMAFPKTQSGADLMLEAPSPPDEAQYDELGLRFVGRASARRRSPARADHGPATTAIATRVLTRPTRTAIAEMASPSRRRRALASSDPHGHFVLKAPRPGPSSAAPSTVRPWSASSRPTSRSRWSGRTGAAGDRPGARRPRPRDGAAARTPRADPRHAAATRSRRRSSRRPGSATTRPSGTWTCRPKRPPGSGLARGLCRPAVRPNARPRRLGPGLQRALRRPPDAAPARPEAGRRGLDDPDNDDADIVVLEETATGDLVGFCATATWVGAMGQRRRPRGAVVDRRPAGSPGPRASGASSSGPASRTSEGWASRTSACRSTAATRARWRSTSRRASSGSDAGPLVAPDRSCHGGAP